MPQQFTQPIAPQQPPVSTMQSAPAISTIPPPSAPTVQQSASNMQSVSQRIRLPPIAGNMAATYMHPAHVPSTLVPSSTTTAPVPLGDSNNPILVQLIESQKRAEERAQQSEERMTTLLEQISKSLSEE